MRRLFLFSAVLLAVTVSLVAFGPGTSPPNRVGVQPASASETDPIVAWYGPFPGQTHTGTDGPAVHDGT